jgi:hypothetical protein
MIRHVLEASGFIACPFVGLFYSRVSESSGLSSFFFSVFDWDWFSEIIAQEVVYWIHLTHEREQWIF